MKNKNEILGGYNPIAWKSVGGYNIADNSFVFSFKDDGISNHILSRVVCKDRAIYNNSLYGPSCDSELILHRAGFYNSYSVHDAYEKSIRETDGDFSVEELEVFKL